MSLATVRTRWTRRRQRKREAAAEVRGFTTLSQRQKKHRLSQLLLTLGLAATFAGGSLMVGGKLIGLALFVVGLPVTVATGVWAIKHWDY